MADTAKSSEKILKTPEAHRKRNKRHYMKMLVEGRCVDCGKVDDYTRKGRSRCKICNNRHQRPERKTMTREQRDEENANKREWARMRKEAHLCIECGKQDKRTLNGKCQCLQCAKKKNDRRRETRDPAHEKELREARKARWVEAGRCSQCGGPKEEPDKAMCATCKVKHKMRKTKWQISHGWLPRGANGKCYQCNREQAMEGKKLCPACYAKKIETLRKNSKHPWKEAQGHDAGD